MQFNNKFCPAKFRSRNESFGFQSPAHGGSEIHFVRSYFQLSVFWTLVPLCIIVIGMNTLYCFLNVIVSCSKDLSVMMYEL